MKLNKLAAMAVVLGLTSASGVVLADAYAPVKFSYFPAKQYFECTVANFDQSTTVHLDTYHVRAQGFCPGGGHLVTSPATVNMYAFKVDTRDHSSKPQMNVNVVGNGTLTCTPSMNSAPSDRPEYAPGQQACAIA